MYFRSLINFHLHKINLKRPFPPPSLLNSHIPIRIYYFRFGLASHSYFTFPLWRTASTSGRTWMIFPSLIRHRLCPSKPSALQITLSAWRLLHRLRASTLLPPQSGLRIYSPPSRTHPRQWLPLELEICSLRPLTWTPPSRTAGCSTSFCRMVRTYFYLFNLLY